MASTDSTAAPIQRASKPTSKAAAQKKAPAGSANPIRRTSRRHAGIAIAGDAAAAPPTGRTGADADANGISRSVTGNGENVTNRAASPAAAAAERSLSTEVDSLMCRLSTVSDLLELILGGHGDYDSLADAAQIVIKKTIVDAEVIHSRASALERVAEAAGGVA